MERNTISQWEMPDHFWAESDPPEPGRFVARGLLGRLVRRLDRMTSDRRRTRYRVSSVPETSVENRHAHNTNSKVKTQLDDDKATTVIDTYDFLPFIPTTCIFKAALTAGPDPFIAIPHHKGDLVWFDPGVGHVLPGEVLEYHRPAQVLTVQAVIAGKTQIFSLTSATGVHRRQDLGQNGIEDMIQLNDLNEASLLWNLKIRYDKELIYTYTGSILVAVNPYKMYDMYGLDMVKKYEGQILGTLSPHLFAVGSAAYGMLSRGNQVVVISGESGSGKTESTKLIMQYLAAVNKSSSNLITEQILEASPLLESFGNAKTVRNDNSSRFGKFLEVHFKQGIILGAKVTEYLLEKSRIVTQAPEERNYHVFYELLAGLAEEDKLKYGLLSADKYFYLNQGGNCEIDGKYDAEDFQSLMSAMQVLGFTSEEQDTIFRILASVLHLGNVYFHRKQLKHGQEGVEIGSDAEIRWTGHLLRLDVEGIKEALTTKTTEARNERVLTALNIDQALDARDAFAKALYSSLFTWLVARINHIVFKGTKKTTAISILDIFGFEDFKENSFEQLCINYANENLQVYFNKHIFKLEQQEYAKEKIHWQNISYNDNLPVIQLLSKKPVGILHLLDDESNFPRATDLSFLEKCHYNHALNELYSRPRLNGPEFGVRHYAGPVWYNVDGFLDKNRDTLRPDVVQLLISSSLPMLSKMFSSLRNSFEASKTLNKANGRFVTMKPRTPTVAARFHDSLQQLLESISGCHPWFVRCIKPNCEKVSMKFDMPTVLEQLRYSGMLETIKIRKLGYPVRMKFSEFVVRYRVLVRKRKLPPKGSPNREICQTILEKHADEYQLGTTRVFLRENLERYLERERAAILNTAAITLQRNVRGFLARTRYTIKRQSAIKVQSTVRGWIERKRYETLKRGIIKAQATFRGRRQRKRYNQLKEEMKKKADLAKERTRSRVQKEEQEKNSRPNVITNLNTLDIPAELAVIFNKIDEWQMTHNERQLIKVVGTIVEIPEQYTLPSDIDQHAFSKFTNIYFKSHVWGMKREPIKTPFLHKSKDADYIDSIAIFKLILRFMNDESLSPKKEQALADYIIHKGLTNERLRDEILCQLVNQTWRNDIETNNERGWLLMASCLSAFPPTGPLYKYLLKYVSDHGYDGYKSICQRKLLSGHTCTPPARSSPPCLLEWRANRKRFNTALEFSMPDGETMTAGVESWTRCHTVASALLSERGIAECNGWTIALDNDQRNGFDYVFDAISEVEMPPGFPGKPAHVSFQPSPIIPISKVESVSVNRRPTVPPPQPPVPKSQKVRSVSRDHSAEIGLSRKSALNDRYFEKSSRSRSLDNLISPIPQASTPKKLDSLGLSHSKLNERYMSMERIQEAEKDSDSDDDDDDIVKLVDDDNLESVSQRGDTRHYNGASSDVMSHSQIDFEYPDINARMEDDKGSYIKGNPRFIKSQYAGKRGSHSIKSQMDKSEARSCAMSDTSEAPSLASHVRRVRVPSQASDVDQFLDDLFNPVLDQLSDARSLAASIKGSIRCKSYEAIDDESLDPCEFSTSIKGENRCVDGVLGSNHNAHVDFDVKLLAKTIKGGGRGVTSQQNGSSQSGNTSFGMSPLIGSPSVMPILSPPSLLMPTMNPQMFNSPNSLSVPANTSNTTNGSSDSMLAYQANLHQAFLQSAMAQNIQIQQQILAQNQALHQLLQQQQLLPPVGPENTSGIWNNSPPKHKSTPTNKSQGLKTGSPQSTFTNVLSELKSRRSSMESNNGKSLVPPPPPMPPPPDLCDPSEVRPFMDPYGRAKTVRIGKWRWPPASDAVSNGAPSDMNGFPNHQSFLQFKMSKQQNQQRHKHSQDSSQDGDINGVEWEEYEIQQPDPPKQSTHKEQSEIHRSSYKSLEVGASRPSPGSVGKLRISNEMKHKLEMVTANHSLRSSTSKPRPQAINNMPAPPTGKLDSDRRLLLQQQLAGRWGSVDSVDSNSLVKEDASDMQSNNVIRSQVERIENSGWRLPPPPITPSRSNSFYNQNMKKCNTSPPAPIQPVTREYEQNIFRNSGSNNYLDQHEIEKTPDFNSRPEHRIQSPQHEDTQITKLLQSPPNAFFTYNRVPWKLNIRKEVFTPKETISSPLVLHLIFCQVVSDMFNKFHSVHGRISVDEREEMLDLLDRFGVTASNMQTGHHKTSTKRSIVELARSWPLYFARIFTVSCGYQHREVECLAITHAGLHLLRKDENQYQILQTLTFEDIADISMGKAGGSVQLTVMTGETIPFHSNRSRQIHSMISSFLKDAAPLGRLPRQTEEKMRITDHKGWQQTNPKYSKSSISYKQDDSPPPNHHAADDGKHSLLQFAMYNFRHSEKFDMLKSANGEINGSLKVLQNSKKKSDDWTWKEQFEMVKYTNIPLSEGLLRLDPELDVLAIECFECIMRYMGDLPTTPEFTEVKCVYTILMHCHKFESLRDEVYCQLMKQTTNNKTESCQRGWRLLSIVAAYFTCSENLRPFLLKYLETSAYDKRRAFHGTANVCLQNLRKTLRYGGRKNVPSVEEVTAVSAGRNSKRQLYRLPGGSETVVNTKSTTVVADVIAGMCSLINVNDPLEMEEFSLYCIVEGDAFTMPLAADEYILDVTTELHKNQQVFYLIFCRSVWYFPLRLDSQLYIQVLFNQIAPDYLEGLLLVLPNEHLSQDHLFEVSRLAALLHRAADMLHPPTLKETKFLLPKPALTQRDLKPAQWVQMVQNHWPQIEVLHNVDAKAKFLEILSKWTLFGSSFFAVKRSGDQQILALNRTGVHFLHIVTHETLSTVPFSEVISTRKVRAGEGATLYLELKCGNLFQQRVARLQTDQAHEIARLVRQYITMHRHKVGVH
ncbi:unconventional myosin-XV isoform X10 [Daktulosphaira vitifoliae]|uniref:unconventional myosin-XV isoform X2 n=1 Tax=Daktulosphaira vitifoliae TaxID=58002 RepID=UPI0021A9B595|nr:unconventional myosin-XV isoform X2 [Daktulosphaira vitifoliae]XP_050539175.1 unconventional myosin-XV isoform X10 [Daktulosphaira vitifoliae]